MKNKIFAIGDIHGCYEEMMLLFNKLPIDLKRDLVIFIGDYVDRGPDSKKVVEQCIKWHKKYPYWIFLYGNHEDIFQNWIRGGTKYQEDSQWSCFFYNGGKETLKSYGISEPNASYLNFPKDHLNFLFNETKILYETDKYIFVHGGLIPNSTINEIKMLLNNKEYEGKAIASADTITNALLWAREGFVDSNWDWGKKVIFGHSAIYHKRWGRAGQPIIMKNKIGIDGAVCPPANKNLIAVELPAEKFYFQESLNKVDFLDEMFIKNAMNL